MKMLLVMGVCLSATMFAADNALADDAQEIKTVIQESYRQIGDGEFEKFFARIGLGSKGFLLRGLANGFPDEESIKAAVKRAQADRDENGWIFKIQPKNIEVTLHGDIAVANFLADGSERLPHAEELRHSVRRVTHVWKRTGDDWKLMHWHASSLREYVSDE